MVIVDSSAWIEALRRQGDIQVKLAVEGLLHVYQAQLCAPARLEVLGGARAEQRPALSAYFSIIPYRRCEMADWERAISLAWRLRGAGLTVPWMDVLIAAIALQDGSSVYSIDAHFTQIGRIAGLPLYRPGYGGKYQANDE